MRALTSHYQEDAAGVVGGEVGRVEIEEEEEEEERAHSL
jgi:hypothetical protein